MDPVGGVQGPAHAERELLSLGVPQLAGPEHRTARSFGVVRRVEVRGAAGDAERGARAEVEGGGAVHGELLVGVAGDDVALAVELRAEEEPGVLARVRSRRGITAWCRVGAGRPERSPDRRAGVKQRVLAGIDAERSIGVVAAVARHQVDGARDRARPEEVRVRPAQHLDAVDGVDVDASRDRTRRPARRWRR